MPTSSTAAMTEGGRPVAQSPGVRLAGAEGGKAIVKVDSGEYAFEAPLARLSAASLKK